MSLARLGRHRAIAAVVALTAGLLVAAPSGAHAAGTPATTATAAARDGRIVYDNGHTGQIYSVNPDGSAVVQLTHTPEGSFAIQPSWFPKGFRIVFVLARGNGASFRLFTMSRDGTNMHRLVAEQSGFNDFTPTVTPDGRAVVYSRCRPDPPGGCALYTVRTNGTHRRALTRYGRGTDRADFFADVSPDGTEVAFSRLGARGIAARVWVIGISGAHPHPLTPVALEAAAPRWLPDGRHLLVTSAWIHLGEQIYRLSVDGGHPVRLTHTRFPHNNLIAAPAPSGRRIAFVSDRAYAQPFSDSDLFAMRADGRRQHPIVHGAAITSDWGTAPLLPASAATPAARLTPVRYPAGLPVLLTAERG